jgi:hypothetical protein
MESLKINNNYYNEIYLNHSQTCFPRLGDSPFCDKSFHIAMVLCFLGRKFYSWHRSLLQQT